MKKTKTEDPLTRREFIKIGAIAGGLLASYKLLPYMQAARGLYKVKETRALMGTIINLAVIVENKADGEAAITATFAELERQIAIFDHRAPLSPVATLNREGRLSNPPVELLEALKLSQAISEKSGGAFDITVKPLIDCYGQAQPNLPGDEAIRTALALVDYRKLSLWADRIELTQSGMAITMDGIAKGFIVDGGANKLHELGFENVFVEAGGDLMATGLKDAGMPWRIGVRDPRDEDATLLTRFNIRDQAVATSGDYMKYYSPDRMRHHILDPRLGASSPELASVTVVSDRAAYSDALATAVMALGTDAGLALIEDLPVVEGLLITKEASVRQSTGFSALMSGEI